MHGTGRDIEDVELALEFKSDIGAWHCLGPVAEHAMSQERRAIVEVLVGAGNRLDHAP